MFDVSNLVSVLEDRKKSLESAPLLKYKKATCFENAPRALQQLALETRIDCLKNVLKLIEEIKGME